ncbi:WGR domain-containing protein [Burkholderia contaminans]|uniref:WGR domain-containing protein n=1 Tax=Burkholderia contaminans TaxID=488447 RepID=UPI003D68000C
MRRFELIEGNSSKFWEVEQDGSGLNIRWGRIGTAGQSQTKAFADDAKARAALDKLVKEKTGKGYAEVAVAAGASIGASAAKPPAAAPSSSSSAAPQGAADASAQPAALNVASGEPPAPSGQPAASMLPSTAASTAAPAPVPPVAAESFDAQCERVFETLRAQIANGDVKPGERLTAAVIKRRYNVGDQGAAMAFDLLKSRRLLVGWGTSATVHDHAQATAVALGESVATGAAAPAPAAPVVADTGTPPWLAHGDPVRLSPQMQREAYASRRFPVEVAALDVRAAWLKIEGKDGYSIDIGATDAALRPAVQRMLDRLAARTPIAGPVADAEADAALFALAMTVGDYHGETTIGRPVVDYLVAQYGLTGTIDVLLDALKIQVHADYDRQAQRRVHRFTTHVDGPVRGNWRGPIVGSEAALREHLAAASEADWQACVDRIEAALPTLHPTRQPVPALLLPDAPHVSNALARRLGAERDVPETLHWMLLTATDPDAIAIAAKIRPDSYGHSFWGMSRMVATTLRERGAAAFDVLERGAADDAAGDGLAAIGTPDAVAALAKVASGSKGALARLSLALDRWPVAGMVALSRLVAAGGKDAGLLTPSLTRLLRAHAAHVDGLRPWLDAPAQAVIDKLLALLAGPAEVASADELPGVLAAPPWLAARQKKAAALTLEPLELAPVESWDEAKRTQAKTPDQWEVKRLAEAAKNTLTLVAGLGFDASKKYYGPLGETAAKAIRQGDAPAFVAAWRAMIDERKRERYFWYSLRAEYLTLLPAAVAVDIWNAIAGDYSTTGVDMLMATFGLPALPGLIATVRNKPTENFSYALNYGAVECAPIAARAFAKLKTLRDDGRAWLLKFPEHAASGLIAPSLGKPGEARDCAGTALRLLQANGHEALLMDVAARYADAAVPQAVRAVLDESPLDRFPTKRSKLPEFWQPRGWRRPC